MLGEVAVLAVPTTADADDPGELTDVVLTTLSGLG